MKWRKHLLEVEQARRELVSATAPIKNQLIDMTRDLERYSKRLQAQIEEYKRKAQEEADRAQGGVGDGDS